MIFNYCLAIQIIISMHLTLILALTYGGLEPHGHEHDNNI